MSIVDNSNPSNMDNNSDITVPLDQNKVAIEWDGNYARVLGILHEVWLHYVRNGIFVTYIQKRAKALPSGKVLEKQAWRLDRHHITRPRKVS